MIAGDLRVNPVTRGTYRGEDDIQQAPREFELLATLMHNKGAVLTRALLPARVWGADYIGDTRTVDVHIRWLREEIKFDPSNPQHIQTVRGVSYRFEG